MNCTRADGHTTYSSLGCIRWAHPKTGDLTSILVGRLKRKW